jgi:prolyl oligopeptidase
MYKQETLSDDPVIFLDPNSLSEDGTVSLATTAFSEDGKTFAYGLSKSGSDWYDVHFKNVETGENYPEVLKKVSEARQAKKLAD